MQAFYPEISAALSEDDSRLPLVSAAKELRSDPEHPHVRPSGFRHGPTLPEPELAQLRHHHAVLHHLRGKSEKVQSSSCAPPPKSGSCQEAEMKDRSEFVPAELKALMKDQDLKHSPSAWEAGMLEKRSWDSIFRLWQAFGASI